MDPAVLEVIGVAVLLSLGWVGHKFVHTRPVPNCPAFNSGERWGCICPTFRKIEHRLRLYLKAMRWKHGPRFGPCGNCVESKYGERVFPTAKCETCLLLWKATAPVVGGTR